MLGHPAAAATAAEGACVSLVFLGEGRPAAAAAAAAAAEGEARPAAAAAAAAADRDIRSLAHSRVRWCNHFVLSPDLRRSATEARPGLVCEGLELELRRRFQFQFDPSSSSFRSS